MAESDKRKRIVKWIKFILALILFGFIFYKNYCVDRYE